MTEMNAAGAAFIKALCGRHPKPAAARRLLAGGASVCGLNSTEMEVLLPPAGFPRACLIGPCEASINSPALYEPVIRLLLESGADANAPGCNNETPIFKFIVKNGKADIARLLLDHGADLALRDCIQWTPLMAAAHDGNLDMVRLMADHGAEIDAQNQNGCTPVMIAVQKKRITIAQELIGRGADLRIWEKSGLGVLELAQFYDSPAELLTLIRTTEARQSAAECHDGLKAGIIVQKTARLKTGPHR